MPNNKKYKYVLLYPCGKCEYYYTLREITKNVGIDFSSLSKLLRNKKYATIGNNKRGRPKKHENASEKPGYKVYRFNDLILNNFYG